MLKQCPDCGGDFEEGCLMEAVHGGGQMIQRYAKATIPETAQNKFAWMFETDMNDIRRVKTFRCKKCNRLFSYAQDFVLYPGKQGQDKRAMFAIIILLTIGILFAIFFPIFISLL